MLFSSCAIGRGGVAPADWASRLCFFPTQSLKEQQGGICWELQMSLQSLRLHVLLLQPLGLAKGGGGGDRVEMDISQGCWSCGWEIKQFRHKYIITGVRVSPGAGEALPSPPFGFLHCKESAGRAPGIWGISCLSQPQRVPWISLALGHLQAVQTRQSWGCCVLIPIFFKGFLVLRSGWHNLCLLFGFYPLGCFCQGVILIKTVSRPVMEYTGHARGQRAAPQTQAWSYSWGVFKIFYLQGVCKFAWASE